MKRMILMCCFMLMLVAVHAQFKTATLQASGLTCAMCNNAINKALKGLPFVNTVKSDIKNASFDISFKENTTTNIDDIRKAVEDAGFFVAKLKLTGSFENVRVKNDEHVLMGGQTFHFLDVTDQTLNGDKTLTILDKSFLTPKEFKRMSSATRMACLETGTMSTPKNGVAMNTRVYHVTI